MILIYGDSEEQNYSAFFQSEITFGATGVITNLQLLENHAPSFASGKFYTSIQSWRLSSPNLPIVIGSLWQSGHLSSEFVFQVLVVVEEISLRVRPTMHCRVCFPQDLDNGPLVHVFHTTARIRNLIISIKPIFPQLSKTKITISYHLLLLYKKK